MGTVLIARWWAWKERHAFCVSTNAIDNVDEESGGRVLKGIAMGHEAMEGTQYKERDNWNRRKQSVWLSDSLWRAEDGANGSIADKMVSK